MSIIHHFCRIEYINHREFYALLLQKGVKGMSINKKLRKESVAHMLIALGEDPLRAFYKIIGISKVARNTDMICTRLQIKERIASNILKILTKIKESDEVSI